MALACLAACKPSKPPLELSAGCQPLLNGYDCFLPYPSDFHRVADPTLPSGFRIETKGAARLVNRGLNCDVNTGKPVDGYSQVPVLVMAFPIAISAAGFPKISDPPEGSLAASSNTVWIEAASGERIPHWVDLDPRAVDLTRQALVLHPMIGLKPRTRYVVGFHHVQQSTGVEVAAPEGFRRLRDQEGAGDPALEPLIQRYDDGIFPALATAGVPRKELQMAWDFTTGSEEHVTADLLRVRELTLSWLSTQTPQIVISQVDTDPYVDLWRKVSGTISMPLFTDKPEPGAKLFRDAQGLVTQNGTSTFPFVAIIPSSVRDQFGPGSTGTYGHGFFGGLPELTGGSSRTIAQRLKRVTWAAEWWGMTAGDVPVLAGDLTNKPFDVMRFVERVPQGMANWLVLTSAIQHGMRDLDAFKRPATGPGVSVDGTGASNAGNVLYPAEPPSFLGISQGHILGSILGALDPDFSRVILNCGGAGFTQMMMRASPFSGYLGLLAYSIDDPLEQQKYIATLQRVFDRIDPATYARFLIADKLPGSPPDRRVLLQNGLGDAEVPNLGTFLQARLLKLPVLTPSPLTPYRLDQVAAPHSGSALALYDFGVDTTALYRSAEPPSEPTPVHDGLRQLEAAHAQMERFFLDGTIINACSGVCDPQ